MVAAVTLHVLSRLVCGVFAGAGVGMLAWMLLTAAKDGGR